MKTTIIIAAFVMSLPAVSAAPVFLLGLLNLFSLGGRAIATIFRAMAASKAAVAVAKGGLVTGISLGAGWGGQYAANAALEQVKDQLILNQTVQLENATAIMAQLQQEKMRLALQIALQASEMERTLKAIS
ncbi:Hypothetical predicted protein, partial [Paramuricea clavata]